MSTPALIAITSAATIVGSVGVFAALVIWRPPTEWPTVT